MAEVDGVKLGLRPVSSLLPHEETIPEHARRIRDQLARQGVQKDPLVVDGETGTVLDGMHRLSAFRELRLEYAVCALVDYSSRSVKLLRWLRCVRAERRDLLELCFKEAGVGVKSDISEAFDAVESGRSSVAMISSRGCLRSAAPAGKGSGPSSIVKRIDLAVDAMGWKETFVGEDELDVALQDENSALVLTPRLSKGDVIEAALTGRLLPHKTTMHVVEPRPVAIDFPIKSLKETKPPEGLLKEKLKSAPSELLPPNSTYAGRRYKERLLVLSGA